MTASHSHIRRRKLSDEVRDRLLSLIRERSLKPGEVIPSERELMAQFGVGRPAVREAMQALQARGLIEINHGERPRIAEPSVVDMIGNLGESVRHTLTHSETTLENLKEARAVFEAQMAKMAARNASQEAVQTLRDILDRQSVSRDDPPQFLNLDGAFHAAIAEMSGNPIFAILGRSLFGWLSDFHQSLVRAPDLEQLTLEEHEGILQAISDGDEAAAVARMEDHLNRANSLYHKENQRT